MSPARACDHDRALAGEFAGATVTILGPFSDVDETKFLESIRPFEEQSGIDIQYTPETSFDSAISVRVDAGDIPDLAIFPQPGLLARFVEQGTWVRAIIEVGPRQLARAVERARAMLPPAS